MGSRYNYFVFGRIQSTVSGEVINIQEGDNLTSQIEHIVANGGLKDVELFVFTDNLVFESVF